jgi:hypothetical protein
MSCASLRRRERILVMPLTSPVLGWGVPGLPAGAPACRARPSVCGTVPGARRAADESVEPWVPVPTAQPTTAGDDLPAMLKCRQILNGEQPGPGRLQTPAPPANKAGPRLVSAGGTGRFDQRTVPFAHPRAGIVFGWADVTASVQLRVVRLAGCCVPGSQGRDAPRCCAASLARGHSRGGNGQ